MSNYLYSTKDFYSRYRKDTDKLISYNTYKRVVYLWNQLIVKKIMEGFKFEAPHSMGIFEILRCDRNHSVKIPDWGASNKLKEEIIARGDIPLEYYKNEKGEITGDNGGANWIVYFTDDTYLKFNWYKTIATRCVSNSLYYKFQCTDGNKKLIRKIKNNPLQELHYKYNDTYS